MTYFLEYLAVYELAILTGAITHAMPLSLHLNTIDKIIVMMMIFA